MPDLRLGCSRLLAQGLADNPFDDPLSALTSLGAMQGQDLGGVISSVALRIKSKDPAEVTESFTSAQLVRGYPMRGTVFVAPANDLAWMTELCAKPAVRAAERRREQLDLDTTKVTRAGEHALELLSHHPMGVNRKTLFADWESAGQPTDKGRGYHLLAYLIGTGSLCYGPWNGKDQNIVSTIDWLPAGSDLQGRFNGDRIAAVRELLHRYLTGHGPATIQDFAWWTKLPLREIRAAHDEIKGSLACIDSDSKYHQIGLAEKLEGDLDKDERMLLLPGFDEFILGYQDRLFAMTREQHGQLVPGNNGVFRRSVLVGGAVRALWRPTGSSRKRILAVEEFVPGLSSEQRTRMEQLFNNFPFPS